MLQNTELDEQVTRADDGRHRAIPPANSARRYVRPQSDVHHDALILHPFANS